MTNLSLRRCRLESGRHETLEKILILYKRSECADPRDRVFSLISLASDYTGREDIFADYTLDARSSLH
jgi:hypothetical protein